MLTQLNQLKLTNLSIDQKSDILAQLSSSISYLDFHTQDLPDLIGDELLRLPDEDYSVSCVCENVPLVNRKRYITR
jgi:hypothetical protein